MTDDDYRDVEEKRMEAITSESRKDNDSLNGGSLLFLYAGVC